MATPAVVELKTCVVCGMQSHRTDWINKLENFVGCDKHSATQMKDAVAEVKASKAPPADEPRSTPAAPAVAKATPIPPAATPATPAKSSAGTIVVPAK